MALIHSLTLSPDGGAARQGRAAFSPVLDDFELPVDTRDAFLLAMSELVTNLGRHPDPLPEHIRISLSRSQSAWQLEIADDGPIFADFETVSARDMNFDVLRESGMGLQLIQDRFPDLEYVPGSPADGGWNRMILRREIVATEAPRPEVLVVDDDPVFLKVLDGYLRDAFSVVGLTSVADALVHLERGGTALIISDIHMPGSDGYAFRRRVLERPGTAEIPFVLLTGSDSDQDRDLAVELSIDDFLTKPVDKRQLITTVRRVLRRTADVRNQIGDRLDAEITDALAPRFETPPDGYSVGTAFEAAAPGGGDLLVEREIDGGHLIVLADIMGHGEQAKFFAHALSGFVYGAVQGLGAQATPGRLLRALSEMFAGDKVLSQSLATALVLVTAPGGHVSVAAAGHPPPFQLRADGAVRVDVGGPLLGLMNAADFPEVEIQMAPGDRIVLYTDGISEAGRRIEDDPVQLLGTEISRLDRASDQDVAQATLDTARARGEAGLEDDATVIVLRRTND